MPTQTTDSGDPEFYVEEPDRDDDRPPTPADALEAAWELFTEAPNDNPTLALAQLSTVNVMVNMGNLAAAIERNEIDSRIGAQLELLGGVLVDENSAHNRRQRQANRLDVLLVDTMKDISSTLSELTETYVHVVESLDGPGDVDETREMPNPFPEQKINDGRDQYDNEPGVLDFMDQPEPPQAIVHPMEQLREMFGTPEHGDIANIIISAIVRGYENANPHFAGHRPVTAAGIKTVVEAAIGDLVSESVCDGLVRDLIYVVTGERA